MWYYHTIINHSSLLCCSCKPGPDSTSCIWIWSLFEWLHETSCELTTSTSLCRLLSVYHVLTGCTTGASLLMSVWNSQTSQFTNPTLQWTRTLCKRDNSVSFSLFLYCFIKSQLISSTGSLLSKTKTFQIDKEYPTNPATFYYYYYKTKTILYWILFLSDLDTDLLLEMNVCLRAVKVKLISKQ